MVLGTDWCSLCLKITEFLEKVCLQFTLNLENGWSIIYWNMFLPTFSISSTSKNNSYVFNVMLPLTQYPCDNSNQFPVNYSIFHADLGNMTCSWPYMLPTKDFPFLVVLFLASNRYSYVWIDQYSSKVWKGNLFRYLELPLSIYTSLSSLTFYPITLPPLVSPDSLFAQLGKLPGSAYSPEPLSRQYLRTIIGLKSLPYLFLLFQRS